MKRKGPRGPKPASVNTFQLETKSEIELAERITRMVLARLRAEAPQLFTAPAATPSA